MGLVGNQNGDAPPQYGQPPSYRPQARATQNPSFRPQQVRQQIGTIEAAPTDRTALIGDHTNRGGSGRDHLSSIPPSSLTATRCPLPLIYLLCV